jgi:hypothetical protein
MGRGYFKEEGICIRVILSMYDLMLSRRVCKMSWVRWFSFFLETKVSKTISVLVLRVVQFNSTALRTRTEMVFDTLVSKKLNHLTRLIAREDFI